MKDRQPVLEEQFKRRYNRDVEVCREVIANEERKIEKVYIDIKYKKNTYKLTEYLTKEMSTDYATVSIGDKEYRYKTYLEAEIFVADMIGDQDGNCH